MKNAPDRKAAESAQEQRQFSTDNPRHQSALALLLQRPARREEIDRAAGCSNAPDLIGELRRRGAGFIAPHMLGFIAVAAALPWLTLGVALGAVIEAVGAAWRAL